MDGVLLTMTKMLQYVIAKIIHRFVTLILVIVLIYVLMRSVPGTPFDVLLYERKITYEQYEELCKEWGYRDDVLTGLSKVIVGSLTLSLFKHRSPITHRIVIEEITWRLVNTMGLVLSAFVFGAMGGMLLGMVVTRIHGRKSELAVLWGALLYRSLPVFWLGMVFLYIFAQILKWFPFTAMPKWGAALQYVPPNVFVFTIDWFWRSLLPLICLSKISMIAYLFTIRNMMLDELANDYVVTMRAVGYDDKTLLEHGVLRCILPPVITMMAIDLGFLVSGAVVTETVFEYPGMGTLIYEAIMGKDFVTVVASFYIVSFAVIVSVTIAEILYAYIDPRIRRG